MIQVQIGRALTRAGVDGVRWVLVDAPAVAAAPAPGAQVLAMAAADAAEAPGQSARARLSLALLRALVLGMGLALAWWLTAGALGPAGNGLRRSAAPATPAATPVPAREAGHPPAPAPAEPAASAAPLITADLR